MNDKNYSEMIEGITNFVKNVSEKITEFTQSINVNLAENILQKLWEFAESIPDDIKDTQFCHAVQELANTNLRYEDVKWLIDDFGIENFEDALNSFLDSLDESNKLHVYLKEIVIKDTLNKREKIVIILAHIELLIYDTLNYTKKSRTIIKTKVRELSLGQSNGISTENFTKLFVLGITYIIFANTDAYTIEIDRRLPFRNHILHNGIISYTDYEIEMVYDVLVDFLSMLVQAKEIMENRVNHRRN